MASVVAGILVVGILSPARGTQKAEAAFAATVPVAAASAGKEIELKSMHPTSANSHTYMHICVYAIFLRKKRIVPHRPITGPRKH